VRQGARLGCARFSEVREGARRVRWISAGAGSAHPAFPHQARVREGARGARRVRRRVREVRAGCAGGCARVRGRQGWSPSP
jgi:hypothetical protein